MGEQPKYRRLASALRREIRGGARAPGERLETEQALADRHGLSRQTVRQALDALCAEGLIDRRRGSGTYVAALPGGQARPKRVQVIAPDIAAGCFPLILRGIEAELSAHGAVMAVAATRNRTDTERRILRACLDSPPDGLLVEGTKTALPSPNLSLYARLQAQGIPIVFVGGAYRAISGICHVSMDDRQGGIDAAEWLLQKGHTAIGGVFPRDDMQAHARCGGVLEALSNAGVMPDEDAIVWIDADARAFGAAALLSVSGCTAAVCHEDAAALWLLEMIGRECSLPVGLELVTFGGGDAVRIAGIPSFGHAGERMGQAAARLLLSGIGGEEIKPEVLPWAAPRA